MISLATTLVRALEDSAIKLRLYVHLQTGVSDDFYCSDGPTAGGKDVGIQSYSSFPSDVDPDTRERGVGSVTISFLDAWLRPIAVNHWIKGKPLKIYLGSEDIPDADYFLIFNGLVQDWSPGVDGTMSVEVHDIFNMLKTETIIDDISDTWVGLHPLDVIYKILQRGSLPTARIQASAFDISLAAFADISHLKVGSNRLHKGTSKTTHNPRPASDMLKELSVIMDGMLLAQDDGIITYKRVDTTTVDRAFTDDDILEGSFEVGSESATGNRINYRFNHDGSDALSVYTVNNSDSQTDMAYPGESARIIELDVEDVWTGGRMVIPSASGWGSGDLSVSVRFDDGFALTGTGVWPVIASHEQVSGSRPMWLMIEDEIVKVTALAFVADTGVRHMGIDEDGRVYDTGVAEPYYCLATIVRGQLGTSPAAHAGSTRVIDITTAKIMTERLLERKAYGLPPIAFRTNIQHIDLELGDVVTLDWPEFVWFGLDGLDANYRWEIIGKEVDPHGAPPSVKFTVSYVAHASASNTTIINPSGIFSLLGILDRLDEKNVNGMGANVHAREEPVISGVSGLQATLQANALSDNDQTTDAPDTTYTYPASKDTYIFQNLETGGRRFESVTLGAGQPDADPGEVPMALITTDGSSIADIDTTLAPLTAFNGDKIDANTVEAISVSNFIDRNDLLGNGEFRKFDRG